MRTNRAPNQRARATISRQSADNGQTTIGPPPVSQSWPASPAAAVAGCQGQSGPQLTGAISFPFSGTLALTNGHHRPGKLCRIVQIDCKLLTREKVYVRESSR